MSLRATCSCGQAFLAIPELAGKVVKCPACGGALRGLQPGPAVPADDDPLVEEIYQTGKHENW